MWPGERVMCELSSEMNGRAGHTSAGREIEREREPSETERGREREQVGERE